MGAGLSGDSGLDDQEETGTDSGVANCRKADGQHSGRNGILAESAAPPAYRRIMATGQIWRTAGGRWLVDQVDGEPGVRYRIWDEGELAVEIDGNVDALAAWLERVGVHIDQLAPSASGVRPNG